MPVHLRAFNDAWCCFGRAKGLPNPTAESGPRWFSCFRGYCKPSPKTTQRLRPPAFVRRVDLSESQTLATCFPNTNFPQKIHLWYEINYLQTASHPTHPPCCETSRYPFFSFLRRTVKSLFCHGVDLETWGWKRFKASRVGGTNSAIGNITWRSSTLFRAFLLLFGASCTKLARTEMFFLPGNASGVFPVACDLLVWTDSLPK